MSDGSIENICATVCIVACLTYFAFVFRNDKNKDDHE